MTANGSGGDLNEEDEVTVAAGSDFSEQIREQTQDLKRERTGDHVELSDDVTVWRPADAAVESEADNDDEFTSDTDATAVMDRDARQELVSEDGDEFDPANDATAVLNPDAREELLDDATEMAAPAQTRLVSPPAVPTMVKKAPVDGTTSLIGDASAPPTSATYWGAAESTSTAPASAVAKRARPRVPIWLLVLVGVIVIVGVSVGIALLVASGASN